MPKTSPSAPPSSSPIPDEIAAFLDALDLKARTHSGDWMTITRKDHMRLRELMGEEPTRVEWVCRPPQVLNYVDAIRSHLIGPVAAAIMRKMCEGL